MCAHDSLKLMCEYFLPQTLYIFLLVDSIYLPLSQWIGNKTATKRAHYNSDFLLEKNFSKNPNVEFPKNQNNCICILRITRMHVTKTISLQRGTKNRFEALLGLDAKSPQKRDSVLIDGCKSNCPLLLLRLFNRFVVTFAQENRFNRPFR